MAQGSSYPVKEISLTGDFGDTVLKVNDTVVDVSEGSYAVVTNPVPANDILARQTAPDIGDEMPDGTICAGYLPYSHEPIYTTPADAPGTFRSYQAQEYAGNLDAHGYTDWHVPTDEVLNIMYENRNKGKLKGTFNETGSNPAGWYGSARKTFSAQDWGQRFSDGKQTCWLFKFRGTSLRCVR